MADLRIPEDKALEVFELAARLYARQNQNCSIEALLKAGSVADIPPEYIQKALSQLQAREEAVQARKRRREEYQQWLQIGSIAAVGVVLGWGVLIHDSLARAAHKVDAAWFQVETGFQPRVDLIPDLIEVTKGSARPAKDVVALLAQARQDYEVAATQPEKVAAAKEVNQALTQFQSTVLTTSQLPANQRYRGLQTELTSTKNELVVQCLRYNQSVVQYNEQLQTFPNSWVSKLLGFGPKPLFEASTPEAP
ncbi:MAG TPA: LemA family protein [Leptolyngbyaceae cyanobacterium]